MRLYGHLSHIYAITNLLEKYFHTTVGKSVKRFKFFFVLSTVLRFISFSIAIENIADIFVYLYTFLSFIISLAATFAITDKAIYYIVWINIWYWKKKGFYFDAHAKSQREKTQLEGIWKIYRQSVFFCMPLWGSMCESS